MSIADTLDSLQSAALYVLMRARAIDVCPRHPDVTLRHGHADAEKHAYALATTLLNSPNFTWTKQDLLKAIKHELDTAARGGCPSCADG